MRNMVMSLELSGGKGGTKLILPSDSISYGKKYFVVNYKTAETTDVYAPSPDAACDMCGWWRKDCLVKLLVSEVTYPLGTRPL